jgi:AraC-like DNA-binding protein
VVLDRALDLLFATVMRAWFGGPAAPSAGPARRDPALGPALRALEADPGRGWTVAGLARAARLSRPAFARRLTDLRLSLAADLLRGTDLTLATIADRVGYASPFALSTAFLRERGRRRSAPGERMWTSRRPQSLRCEACLSPGAHGASAPPRLVARPPPGGRCA